jgi:polyisoprenoid-binding protein YceI
MATILEPTVQTETRTWQLDAAHSNIEFAVKHMMIATVKGRFGEFSGTVTVDPTTPDAANVDVSIDVASIDTRQAQRDAHLRSADFFDAENWPSIRFVGKKVEGDVQSDFVLVGDITIRDVTKEIKLQVTNEGAARDPWGNDRVGFSAKGKIDRRDFGLTWNAALETGGVVVGDEIKISIDAEFTAA